MLNIELELLMDLDQDIDQDQDQDLDLDLDWTWSLTIMFENLDLTIQNVFSIEMGSTKLISGAFRNYWKLPQPPLLLLLLLLLEYLTMKSIVLQL